ncbi:hypothetical protein J2857_006120 [Neorhizobium galegae]|uniref:hypothetical protein n=1 Tax=Neorhizobium galegae TaxID=399 RepID=UPI001AE799FE|nr:hypothetical protein [Neorhizobium galegae]MBP2563321.1 hypothetical protein [Neorhizobium galegae]
MKRSLFASLAMLCIPLCGQALCAEVDAFIIFKCPPESPFLYIANDPSLIPFVDEAGRNYLIVFELNSTLLHPQAEANVVTVEKGKDGFYTTDRDLVNDEFTISAEAITHVKRKFDPLHGESIVGSEVCYRSRQ